MSSPPSEKRTSSLPLGQLGEQLACRYLTEKGYAIRALNYKNEHGRRLGEIDIIAQKDGWIVFVEVKTRLYTQENIPPEENITPGKLKKLEKIAWHFLRSQKLENHPHRFDALAILYDEQSRTAKMRHLKHIFL